MQIKGHVRIRTEEFEGRDGPVEFDTLEIVDENGELHEFKPEAVTLASEGELVATVKFKRKLAVLVIQSYAPAPAPAPLD